MVVLDASALLAFLFGEPGAKSVESELPAGVISAVNLTETVTRLVRDGHPGEIVQAKILKYGLVIADFDRTQSVQAAMLYPLTCRFGLSLGDRACLALGMTKNLPVLTADRVWADLDLPLEIRVIR